MIRQARDAGHRVRHTLTLFACALLAAGTAKPALAQMSVIPANAPGPSQAVFTHHYYSCVANYYVSPSGKDSNPGTQAAPWATLQHANDSLPTNGSAAGTCINVVPGTYSSGVLLTAGGAFPDPTGYVVYRCETLDGCKITADGDPWHPVFFFRTAGGPNFVFIDGFEMAASQQATYGLGVNITNNSNGAPNSSPAAHHVWIVNNVIHGYGQAGIGAGEADWIFTVHNLAYDNSHVTCDAQGSGIGYVVAKHTPNYTPHGDDSYIAPYHQVIGWNIAHDNILMACGNASNPYDTDGNGIIIDTFNGSGVDNVLYPDRTLVIGNVTYSNGAKGIHVFRSAYVDVANNTSFNNNLDPWNQGFPRGEINNAGSFGNRYLNNIALAYPAASPSDPRCQGANYDIQPAPCPLMANVAFLGGDSAGVTDVGNQWAHNITLGGSPPWGWGPKGNVMLGNDTAAFSCNNNKCEIDPLLVAPTSDNFALKAGSPALGYGIELAGSLPATVDAGGCPRAFATCD
jgi:hypothetical protein